MASHIWRRVVSLKKTYTIQGADLTIKVEESWESPEKMVRIFTSYDWSSELSLQAKLEDENAAEVCPPGLILLREMGVYLHLCPNLKGTVTIYCTQKVPGKIFGIFKTKWDKLVTKEDASHDLAQRAIVKFMANDENWLQANIKED